MHAAMDQAGKVEQLAVMQRLIELRREKARREDARGERLAREQFFEFYMRMMIGGNTDAPQPHHRALCAVIQMLQDNEIDRAIISIPPRMAKSTICSMLAPAWIIGRDPSAQIIVAGHTAQIAERFCGWARNVVLSDNYPFNGVRVKDDTHAKRAWETARGGAVRAFGEGGSPHGSGADWLIIDDIISNLEVADSANQRDRIYDGYHANLLSRLQGRRKQMIIGTRWHEDDLTGRIVGEGYRGETGFITSPDSGEKWYVLNIPAEAEENDPIGRKPGEMLWEHRQGDHFRKMKAMGGRLWAAMYQGRPAPEEGLMFKREHIRRFSLMDLNLDGLAYYISCDYAVSTPAGAHDPDYTVHAVWAVDGRFNIYLVDMWRGRTESPEWLSALIDLYDKWRPIYIAQEAGQILRSVGPFFNQMAAERGFSPALRPYTSVASKEQRAQALLGFASAGRLYVRRNHPHMNEFIDELLSFPAGKHDDMVDAASLFARMAGDIQRSSAPRGKKVETADMREISQIIREANYGG